MNSIPQAVITSSLEFCCLLRFLQLEIREAILPARLTAGEGMRQLPKSFPAGLLIPSSLIPLMGPPVTPAAIATRIVALTALTFLLRFQKPTVHIFRYKILPVI